MNMEEKTYYSPISRKPMKWHELSKERQYHENQVENNNKKKRKEEMAKRMK